MSQRLPPRPNLGHLKKQAKDVLRVFRHRNPRWRLVDAQHALARGYGFPSWPDLKLHVESVRQQPPSAVLRTSRLQPADTAGESPQPAEQELGPSRHSIVGTWVARPATGSEGHHQYLVGDAVVEFELTDGTLTLTQIAAGAAGREIAMKMVIHADGQDRPIQFGSELLLQARWTNGRTLEAITKHGERIVSRGTWEVSPDGESLVLSTAGQRVVFGRV
jgi:hypothetical protein